MFQFIISQFENRRVNTRSFFLDHTEQGMTKTQQAAAQAGGAGGGAAGGAARRVVGGKAPRLSAKAPRLNAKAPRLSAKGISLKSNAGKEQKEKKKRKFHPGTVALREIRRYQKSTELLIPRLPFQRFVKEVIQEVANPDLRMRADALEALREAAEAHLVKTLEDGNRLAIHARRVTIRPSDMQLAQVIQRNDR